MSKTLQAIRGMRDILPNEMTTFHTVEAGIRELMHGYHYQEIRLPVLESTELFKRSVGEETDIVGKEMYSFLSRSDEPMTLRPEGTAGCMRAGIEHGLFYNQTQKFWYLGPMFRYERPQKGRYRQFQQWGVEAVGIEGHQIELEMILLGARLWQILGITDKIQLQVNSLGSPACRQHYRALLQKHFHQARDQLNEAELQRLARNPLRLLDSKNPALAELIASAPRLDMHMSNEAKAHFAALTQALTEMGISFVHNPHLVRGLDYYQHTVFEWVTEALGAQNAVAAGGRYDGLIEQLGGQPSSAVGFAMGVERVAALLKEDSIPKVMPDVAVFAVDNDIAVQVQAWTESLRDALGLSWSITMDHQGGSHKNQSKRADKLGARASLLIDKDAWEAKAAPIKTVDGWVSVPLGKVAEWLRLNLTQEKV